jgi:hypothetical protein
MVMTFKRTKYFLVIIIRLHNTKTDQKRIAIDIFTVHLYLFSIYGTFLETKSLRGGVKEAKFLREQFFLEFHGIIHVHVDYCPYRWWGIFIF